VFNKALFAILWSGMLGYAAIRYLPDQFGTLSWMMLAPIGVLGCIGALSMKHLWRIVDAVYDCGDTLIVRRAGREDTISLSNIRNVVWHGNSRLRFITLQLESASRFGAEIMFVPSTPLYLDLHTEHPIAVDLARRATAARLTGR
jgi:hypothetical protein